MAAHMTRSMTFDRQDADRRDAGGAAQVRGAARRVPDDMAMLRTAAELTRDINAPNPRIYWPDLVISAAIGYGALVAAVLAPSLGWTLLAALVAVFALYRAESFIHELTHLKHSALPGFRLGWNLLVGIPLMVPSFMYEGVHNLHHARTRYGTDQDPEYLPLALMKWWSVPAFVAVAALAPIGLLIRFGVIAPLSLVFPRVRAMAVAQLSALSINPGFRRRAPEGEARTMWHRLEIATSLWAVSFLAMAFTGVLPLKAVAVILGVASAVAVINQVRTLVAHLWENEGEAMSVTAQYLDSVNVQIGRAHV